MNRGRGRGRAGNFGGYSRPRGAGNSAHRHSPLRAGRPPEDSLCAEESEKKILGQMSVGSVSKHSEHKPKSSTTFQQKWLPVHRHIPLGADRPPEDSLGAEESEKEILGDSRGAEESEKKILGQMSVGSVSKHSEHKPKSGTTHQEKWFSYISKDGFPIIRRNQQGMNSPDGVASGSKRSKCLVTSDSAYKQDFPPLSGHSGSEGLDGGRIHIGQISGGKTADCNALHHDLSKKLTISGLQSETLLPSQSARKAEQAPRGAEESETKILGQMSVGSVSKHSEHKPKSSTTFQQKWLPMHRHIPLGADRPPEDSLGAEESEKEILGDSRGAEESETKILGQMSVGSVSKHSEHKPKSGTTHQEKWFSYISKDGFPILRRNQQGMNSPDGVASGSKRSKCLVTSDSAYKQDFPPLSGHSGSEGLDGGRIQIGQISGGKTADCNALHHDLSEKLIISGLQSETLLPSQSVRKAEQAPRGAEESETKILGQMSVGSVSKHSEHKPKSGTTHQQKWFTYISKDGFPILRRNQQGMNSPDGVASGSKRSKCLVTSDSAYKPDFPPLSGHSGSEGLDGGRIQIGQISGGKTADCNALHHDLSEKLIISGLQSETLLPSQSVRKAEQAPSKGPKSSTSHNNSKHSEHSADITLLHEFSEKFIIFGLQCETQLPSQSAKKDEPIPSKGPKSSTSHNNSKHSEHSADITLRHEFSEKFIISDLQSETLLPSLSARKAEPAPSKGPKSSTSHNNSKHSEHSANITLRHEFSEKFIISGLQSEIQLPSQSAKKDEPAPSKGPKSSTGHNNLKPSEHSVVLDPFDICPKTGTSITLKPPLRAINRQRQNEIKRSMEGQNGIMLRSGMILLQGYISLSDQVMIVKLCQHLGLGSGGFYQPGYRDGGKLQLRMMCLGKNWDPESRKYGDERPFDGAKPPNIPNKFYQLVKNAITDSHSIIKKNSKASNVENILPSMSPDICCVNFYTANGRLGLHQDRDESQESLDKELPVVSFSIGDSADFLYGDQRDEDKAEKVKLESGDVIIFGGKSRHVFHGITAIHPNTTPKPLLEETNLRPGRLNLTFKQY